MSELERRVGRDIAKGSIYTLSIFSYTCMEEGSNSYFLQEKDITVHYPRDTFISRLCLVVPGIDKSKFVVSIGRKTSENFRNK